jgi:hypothetical protein
MDPDRPIGRESSIKAPRTPRPLALTDLVDAGVIHSDMDGLLEQTVTTDHAARCLSGSDEIAR